MSTGFVDLGSFCERRIERFSATTWPRESFVYLDVSAIDAKGKSVSEPRTLATKAAPSRASSVVRAGDILVSTVRPNLNAVARVPPHLDGSVCSSAFAVLRPLRGDDCDGLFAYVQSPTFTSNLVAAAQGSHYPAVSDDTVFSVAVDLSRWYRGTKGARLQAALNEARCAAKLVDDQLAIARELPTTLLRVDFDGQAAINAGSHRAGVLLGWNVYLLSELARLESGHTPSRRHTEWWGGPVPWLALPDIRKLHGKLAHETTENINDAGLANSSARLLPSGTVCVSRTASIGFVTVLRRPMATSQDFCNWVCNPERLDPEFLMYAFMGSQESLRELGSGAVHKTIYMPTIQSFHISAPAIAEQRRIARMLRDQLAAAELLQKRLSERQAEIERLPQRILAAAFGEAD